MIAVPRAVQDDVVGLSIVGGIERTDIHNSLVKPPVRDGRCVSIGHEKKQNDNGSLNSGHSNEFSAVIVSRRGLQSKWKEWRNGQGAASCPYHHSERDREDSTQGCAKVPTERASGCSAFS